MFCAYTFTREPRVQSTVGLSARYAGQITTSIDSCRRHAREQTVDERARLGNRLVHLPVAAISGVRAECIRHDSPDLVHRQQRRAEHAGADAMAGETDDRARARSRAARSRAPRAWPAAAAARRPARPAADHDLVGIERVDRIGDADPDVARPRSRPRPRRPVAIASRPHRVRAEDGPAARPQAAERRLGMTLGGLRQQAGRARGRRRSDSSDPGCGNPSAREPPGPRPRGRRSCDRARPRRRRATVDPPAEHEPAADACSDCEHHQVVGDQSQLLVVRLRRAPRRSRRCR